MEASAPTRSTPQINPWLVAIAVMLATFMEVVDTSIAAVAYADDFRYMALVRFCLHPGGVCAEEVRGTGSAGRGALRR